MGDVQKTEDIRMQNLNLETDTTEGWWKEEIQINGRDGFSEKTEAASVAHLVAGCTGFPLCWKGFLKSEGSLVDVNLLWILILIFTLNSIYNTGSLGLDYPNGGCAVQNNFTLHYIHLDSVNQTPLINIKTELGNHDYWNAAAVVKAGSSFVHLLTVITNWLSRMKGHYWLIQRYSKHFLICHSISSCMWC